MNTRVLPATRRARPTPVGLRPHRIWERNLLVYKRIWRLIFSGFFEPIFYLFSIGVGLGALVGELEGPGGQLVEYTAFVAPALLAAAAMNGAVFDTTFNIFFKLKFGKVYDGVLTTPMQPRDIALGEIGWSLVRGGLYAFGFFIVMLALGLVDSWWALLALPGALLIGLAFGAAGFAATTFMNSWQDFDLVQLVTLPLFLFSATFYPVTVYPAAVQILVRLSPLYHGVEIIRGLTLGVVDITMVGHALFLLTMTSIGLVITSRRLEQLLMK